MTTHPEEMQGLGANERALLETITWGPARRTAVRIVRLKLRLQFTGWLQYLLPLPFIVVLAVLGCLSWCLGGPGLATVFLVPTGALAAIAVFDVVTTRWKIRPPERRPPPLDELDLVRDRRSCRSFQTRLMSDTDREAVFAVVERELRVPPIGTTAPKLEYVSGRLTVWPTVNASEFLVAIVPKPYDRMAIVDIGRALERVVMNLTRMGLATCWIGPGADQDSIVAHLGARFDAESDHVVCVCAVGYRSGFVPLFLRLFNRKMSTSRRPLSELFFSDMELSHPLKVSADGLGISRFTLAYEACRWAPSSYNGQTTRGVVETNASGEVTAVKFLAASSSRYYAPVALGIWCANWELACETLGITGHFEPERSGDELPRHDVTWLPSR